MYRKIKLVRQKNTLGSTSQGEGKPWALAEWMLTNVLPRTDLYKTKADLEQVLALTAIFSKVADLELLITDDKDQYAFLSEGQWEWLCQHMEPDRQFSPGGIAPRHQAHLASLLLSVHTAEQISEEAMKKILDAQKREPASEQAT